MKHPPSEQSQDRFLLRNSTNFLSFSKGCFFCLSPPHQFSLSLMSCIQKNNLLLLRISCAFINVTCSLITVKKSKISTLFRFAAFYSLLELSLLTHRDCIGVLCDPICLIRTDQIKNVQDLKQVPKDILTISFIGSFLDR